VRVHLAGKHALKFEFLDLETQAIDVGLDLLSRCRIGFLLGQIQKFRRIAQAPLQAVQAADHLLEFGAFLAQFLSTLRVIPNAGLLELALYFLQALMPIVVIKDTSSKSRYAPRDL
jgi:hypothetical protein